MIPVPFFRTAKIRHSAGLVLSVSIVLAAAPAAAQSACPIAGQKPMLVAQLFLGQTIRGHGPVSAQAWRDFLRQVVTPRFPEGFTVLDAYGQWMNPRTRHLSHEATKVLVIAIEDTPAARTGLAEISDHYRERFHQKSVGIVTSPGCAMF